MKTKTKKEAEQISKSEFLAAQYHLIIMPDGDEDDPGFIAKVNELPGLLGYGSTETEAIEDFHNVKGDWYDSAIEMNVPIAPPKGEESAEYSGKFVVRMSPELHKTVSQLAEQAEMSLNTYIVQTLRKNINAKDANDDLKAMIASTIRETLRREIHTINSPVTYYTSKRTDIQALAPQRTYKAQPELEMVS